MIEFEELDLSPIAFSDPMSALTEDMWLSYKAMGDPVGHFSSAMLLRPRLSREDVVDMVENPNSIQLFQFKSNRACLGKARRERVAQMTAQNSRGIRWMTLERSGRSLPPPRLR